MSPPPILPPKPQQQSHVSEETPLIVPGPLNRSLLLLPKEKLREFQSSEELLNGYIATLEQFKSLKSQQLDISSQEIQRIDTLIQEFQLLMTDKTVLNQRLTKVHELELEFRQLESQMFDKFSKYQINYRDVLNTKLTKSLELQKQSSDLLLNNVNNDDDLQEFVNNYKHSQEKYHYKLQIQKRLQDNKITGVL